MKREYHKWFSQNLRRNMELLVYGHAGAKVLLFPTRTARFFDYENWRIIESLQHHIEQGWLQVYTLDSIDQESFYCFWAHPQGRIHRHMEYEQYILDEVIPFANTNNPNPFLMSVGCSMGAFHAVNLALRYPHLFGKVVALSGRYDLTLNLGMFYDLMDGYYSDYVYHHSPSHFMPNMPEGEQLNHIRNLQITIVCGKEDVFLQNNRDFSQTLTNKGINHHFYEWEGEAHKAKYWRLMLPLYL
ncbi:MAG: alpha/beta hydrolase-fold protein [Paludibacter sp.]|nr:alpha/beta hydrolase-fold protein [Paludibacter sp.]